MKVQMEQWEIERIKDKIGKILEFWSYNSITMSGDHDRKMSMSTETFIESLERELKS